MTHTSLTQRWNRLLDKQFELLLAIGSLGILALGIWGRNHLASSGAVICLLLALHRRFCQHVSRRVTDQRPLAGAGPTGVAAAKSNVTSTLDARLATPKTASALVNEMIFQGRYAVLARPEVAKNLSEQQRQEVLRVLQEEMSPVKAGRVLLHAAGNAPESHPADVGEVGAIMIDRYAVSNAEYHEFVAAGGYEQPELWAPEIRQSLATFIDLTQHAGPRYWRNSRFAPGTADHPVVGICWFEADAYARWIGKRLPRDTEWIKAAVSARSSMISAEQLLRYPWGNAFRDDRANLWSSGKGQTVPVAEYPGGQSSDGVYQLVGNVWEWMDGELREMWRSGELLSPSQQYKTLRGGAFDTYLESQSACHMVSGDSPLARRSNIGFRCVLNASDVNLTN